MGSRRFTVFKGDFLMGRRLCIVPMLAALLSSHAPAQTPAPVPNLSPEQRADTEALRALAASIPLLPVERIELKVNPPMTLVGYSAAAADKHGNIYVIHRPADPKVEDPVVVLDAKGNFVRSWGKGMYTMPHSIRVDPAGNIWTVDARTSMIFKFTPEGKKLLEISVGDIPDASLAFCGATDVTFAPNGHVYVSDGYCNARFLEYTAEGKKVREWGRIATLPLKTFRTRPGITGPGEFAVAHDISLGPDGILYVADRENGRLQWFDKSGKYLGEKKFGGQLFSVAHSPAGDLYVGAQPRDVPFGKDSIIFKFDPKSGKILGKIEAPAHQLSVGPDGTLLPGIRSAQTTSVLLLRPLK
jgi:DNA-binding beta-propeller fold protein YncE